MTYQCQDQGIQQCDYSRRFPHVKNQSQNNQLEDRRTGGIERKQYLHRKLPDIPIPGARMVAHVAADEVENSRQTVKSYHNVGAAMCQSGLVYHHARVRIRGAFIPIVVHRAQNIREYSATDHSSRIISRNHDG